MGAPFYSVKTSSPDAALVRRVPPDYCLSHSVLPWGHFGPVITVATSDPDGFEACRPRLEAIFGPVVMSICTEEDIHKTIARLFAEELSSAAETWVRDEDSCRDLNLWTMRRAAIGVAVMAVALLGLVLATDLFFLAIFGLTLASLCVAQGAKVLAWIMALIHNAAKPDPAPRLRRFPLVTVLVPLFHEKEIAEALVARLGRIAYPKASLDVALVLEAEDHMTRAALGRAALPPWMRVIEVPPGTVQTKPRALNYALRFCKGEIIGIYDAEDAPAPDQISKVVAAFQRYPKRVACVQAILDFYNSKANWLSRCFAIEYATWFRVMLPGFYRLGFPVPLGGTSVFFRRSALMSVRGWDAHNVTEDADLGIRLARYGYETRLIRSVTREEANNRAWPWIKQRSRWLKGYMITYFVHMRRPLSLWQDLGPGGFIGVQVIFLAALLQFTLAPSLWLFWAHALGLPLPSSLTPAADALSLLTTLFLASEAVSILVGLTAVSLSPHSRLLPWVPTMSLYFPMATLAAYKAAYELIAKPFYWDKTMHGHSGPDPGQPP
jgi:cellulose synthase/poly-beta-1,6-N-acetylglucosamine synthase-like glycosyltransferase